MCVSVCVCVCVCMCTIVNSFYNLTNFKFVLRRRVVVVGVWDSRNIHLETYVTMREEVFSPEIPF